MEEEQAEQEKRGRLRKENSESRRIIRFSQVFTSFSVTWDIFWHLMTLKTIFIHLELAFGLRRVSKNSKKLPNPTPIVILTCLGVR